MRNLGHAAVSSSLAAGRFDTVSFASDKRAAKSDAAERQLRLAALIAHEIIPRLISNHHDVPSLSTAAAQAPSPHDVEELARLVLGPNMQTATNYVLRMGRLGLPLDVLFVDLLGAAAHHIGLLWEDDRCDFLDVTLGVARLQELMAVFNDTHKLPAFAGKRRVLTAATTGEQHRFGLAMVERFLRADGWDVHSEGEAVPDAVAAAVQAEWFAVAGITLGCETRLDALADLIKTIRQKSRNPSIGIMVGGPLFIKSPDLARRVGADEVALNAPAAVILAQKLFDVAVASRA